MKRLHGFLMLAFIALGSGFIMGCQGSDDQGTSSLRTRNQPITPSYNENIVKVLKSMELSCADSKFCPEYVGLVAVNSVPNSKIDRERIQFCTGFVIQEGWIATSASCVRQHEKLRNQNDCSNNLAVRFIRNRKSNNHSETYACKSIIGYANKDLDQNYLIFQVENLSIAPPDLNINGIEDGESVRIPVFQLRGLSASLGKSTQAQMEGLNCITTLNTLLHTQSTSPWSITALALQCESRQSNWGAPVVNSLGKVVGIVQNHNLPRFNDRVVKNLKSFDVADSLNLVSSVMFTHVGCIEDLKNYSGQSSNQNKENCELLGKQELRELLVSETGWPEKSKALAIEEWRAELPEIFRYEIVEREKYLYEAKVLCVKNQIQLGEEVYKKFVKREGWAWDRQSKIEVSLSSQLSLGPKYFIDELMRVKSEWKIVEKKRSFNRIVLTENKGQWFGNFQTWITDGDGGKTAKTFKLPTCAQ